MSQPLGAAVGNALEVAEGLRVLRNQTATGPEHRFRSLCIELARHTLEAAGASADPEALLRSGAALDKAEAWFAAQGAPAMDPLLEQLVETPIVASADGFISRIDAGAVGEMVLDLGGGRRRKDDAVDLQVGATVHRLVGDPVREGEPVLTIHSRVAIESSQIGAWSEAIIRIGASSEDSPLLFL